VCVCVFMSVSKHSKALEDRIGVGAGRVMCIKTHYYCRIAFASIGHYLLIILARMN